MGFFDLFSKSFRRSRDADSYPAPYTTLSLFSDTRSRASATSETEQAMAIGAGSATAVAVAEPPAFSDVVANGANAQHAIPSFDSDFDRDLDDVFASLERQSPSNSSISASSESSSNDEIDAGAQRIVEQLFADIAANYARPIKNFIFELKRGTATKEWVDICRPAMQGITRAAEGMGLHLAAQRMIDFEAALSIAERNEQRVLSGEVRNLLLWCYDDLVKVMPKAFAVGEKERQQREGIIINSLLLQIPDVGRVSIDKLYRAGLTSLEALYLARRDELATATGIPKDVCERICAKFQAYRSGLEASRAGDFCQKSRLGEFVSELRRLHEGYVRASEDPDLANEKKELRQQRQSCVLWINVILAESGELDFVNELEKVSFERRIERLEEFLRKSQTS